MIKALEGEIELIYDILHKIEKNVPQNVDQIRHDVLIPAYRFVTSANFVIGTITIALVVALMLLPMAFAMTQVSSDRAYIKELHVESDGINHTYGFQICAGDESLRYAKVIVTSDSDMVVLTTQKPIQENNCRSFAVNITANDVDSIHAKLVEPIRA